MPSGRKPKSPSITTWCLRSTITACLTRISEKITLRIAAQTLEVFYQNKRIAGHCRAFKPGFTTLKAHMLSGHQAHLEWTPERLMAWAHKVGPATGAFIHALIETRPFPQQAYRACLGTLSLGKQYGKAHFEKAATRAIALGAFRFQSIKSILKNRLDEQLLPLETKPPLPTAHANVRGAEYYQ